MIPTQVKSFLKETGVSVYEVQEKLMDCLTEEPRLSFKYDTKSYARFKTLRVEIHYKGFEIQPLLFGSIRNLTKLSEFLWLEGAEIWDAKMEDITCPSTFNKKMVLNPAILKLARKYVSKNTRILDVGCGQGSLTSSFYDAGNLNVHGFDISEDMIEIAKDKIPANKENFRVLNLVKDKINGDLGKFDLVICSMVFSNVIEDKSAFENLVKLVEEGGIILFVDINPYYYGSLGYIYEDNIVPIHNPKSSFYTEKKIGGHTKAVHAYRSIEHYGNLARTYNLNVLEEFVFPVEKELYVRTVCKNIKKGKLRDELINKMPRMIGVPPFYFLILRK